MTKKSGKISAKTQDDARQKAIQENPGWCVVKIKKLHTVYHVTLEKIERYRRKK